MKIIIFSYFLSREWKPFENDKLLPPISRKKNKGVLRTFAQYYYGPVLLHPFTKIFVLFLFVGLLFYGIVRTTQVDVGMNNTELFYDVSSNFNHI